MAIAGSFRRISYMDSIRDAGVRMVEIVKLPPSSNIGFSSPGYSHLACPSHSEAYHPARK